ncbi:hypothetical protein N431DRAFT_178819 [Stipitochalara longipes BDJ]|nr:hypothetical protein N431DRAFT_178819 [Stipitochalara longipes BDJ]
MADPKQQCNWCVRTSPFISKFFTPLELQVHLQDVHPKIKVMGTRHRCPHEACLDVDDATFNFAHEVKEHLEKVHGGLVGAWKEREEAKVRRAEEKELRKAAEERARVERAEEEEEREAAEERERVEDADFLAYRKKMREEEREERYIGDFHANISNPWRDTRLDGPSPRQRELAPNTWNY